MGYYRGKNREYTPWKRTYRKKTFLEKHPKLLTEENMIVLVVLLIAGLAAALYTILG